MELKQFLKTLSIKFKVDQDIWEKLLIEKGVDNELHDAFCDLLEKAIAYSPEKTRAALVGAQNATALFISLIGCLNLDTMLTMPYSIDELAADVKESAKLLRKNKASLIKTGLATHYNGNETEIEMLCSRMYFTKLPTGMRVQKYGSGYIATFAWSGDQRVRLNPHTLPPLGLTNFLGNNLKSLDWSAEPFDQNTSLNYSNGKTLTEVERDADWIEQIREKVFSAKDRTLELIAAALRKREYVGLWESVMKILSTDFNRDEIEKLLRLDPKYEPMINPTSAAVYSFKQTNGGLSELLWFLGYCECELRMESVATLSAVLRRESAMDADCANEFVGKYGKWMKRYLDASVDRQNEIDAALAEYWSDADQTIIFWRDFGNRLKIAVENEFTGTIPVKAKGKYKNLIEKYVEQLEEMQNIGAISTFVGQSVSQQPGITTRSLKRPNIPSGTKWTDITFTMKTSESVQIKVKGQSARTYLYSDLGLKNGNTNGPDRNWLLLRQFSKKSGVITPSDGQIQDVKKRVSDLRSILAEIFGLPGNTAIQYSAKGHCYRTTFHVTSEIADDRKPSSPTAMPSARTRRTHYEDDGAATELDQLIDEQADDDNS